MQKNRKKVVVFFTVIAAIIALVIGFISPIAKRLVEKYDERFTGRQITMDWAYVNPFTGYVYLNDVRIYEYKRNTLFFTSEGVSANFSMLKLFSNTLEISELVFDKPQGVIIQKKKLLNFTDLIDRFSSPSKKDGKKASLHFNILDIKVVDGRFYYSERITPVNYFIKNVNIESKGKIWDSDSIAAHFSLVSGIGKGDMNGDLMINVKSLDYRLEVDIHKFDLQVMEQYLKDLTNYGNFSANMDANLKTSGNFKDKENMKARGVVAINDFHFGKNPKDDYTSFERLSISIRNLSPKDHAYLFDSVSLLKPYFKFERYDHLDNMQTMFGRKGENVAAAASNPKEFNLVIEIARYIKVLGKNFLRSDYKIDRFAIYNGNFKFNDYSLGEKFALDLKPVSVVADSIDKDHLRVNALVRVGIAPSGTASVALSINPMDSSDFDIQYRLERIPATIFNPYIIEYTSFPLDRGTLELKGNWQVRNGMVNSVNHVVIIDPRASERLRHRNGKWIPVPLVLFFVRERGNVIDYEIPITGNLKDPKFHVKDVILDALGNVFVKPLTTPYRREVKRMEAEIEKSLSLKWEMADNELLHVQENFIEKVADYLKENPGATISIYPEYYSVKEKEYILMFEAKKKYFLETNKRNSPFLTKEDSTDLFQLSIKDEWFMSYLNKRVKDSLLFTVQDKSARIIDSATVNKRFAELNAFRIKVFMSFFYAQGVQSQVKVAKAKYVIPYSGFSIFRIAYNGELPGSLVKAYERMSELNSESPRKKFKQERNRLKERLKK